MSSQAKTQKARLSLSSQVLVGLVFGLAAGVFFGDFVAPLKIVGEAFIKLLQITVIPYIVVALITGLGRLEHGEVRKLALSGGSIVLAIWVIGIATVLFLTVAFPDWPSRSLFQKSSLVPDVPPDFLELYIPSNPFHSLANAIVPAIVVFSILIGVALIRVKNKSVILEPLSAIAETLATVTGYVSKLAPIGVFALVASASGSTRIDDLARLQVYVIVMVAITGILGLVTLPALIASVTPLKYGRIVRELRTPLVTAFATQNALVVLPLLAEICKSLVSESTIRPPTADEEEESESSVDILIPTFYSFPALGAVLHLGFILFAGWYVGLLVPLDQYPTLVSAGLASLFGGALLAIPFLLQLLDLPGDLMQVFLSMNVLNGRLSIFLNVMTYATIALIGTFALQNAVRIRLWPTLRVAGLTVGLIAGTLLGVHAFYSHVLVVPYTKDDVLKSLRFLNDVGPAVVHRTPPVHAQQDDERQPRTYSSIVQSGTLRVCYLKGNYPLSFFNDEEQLVGFDIEMAHLFAARLNVTPEFRPLTRLGDAPDKLVSGYCDVVFNAVYMGLERTEKAAESISFATATIAFIVPDYLREVFSTWDGIRERERITVAMSAYQSLPRDILTRMPNAEVKQLTTLREQIDYFESGGTGADAFIDTAQQGAAWTILYPHYTLVVPRPALQMPVVYLTAIDRPLLLRALNAWLLIEAETGAIAELEQYWVEGKIDAVRPPRWSIVRDVLGWVD